MDYKIGDITRRNGPEEETGCNARLNKPSYDGVTDADHSFHIRDEIDLEPVLYLPRKELSGNVHSPPRPSKSFTKRIQLSKIGSYTDSPRVDEGPSYGLPDIGSRQSERIIQGSNVDPASDVNDTKDHYTTEAETRDHEAVNISSLSLGVDPGEIMLQKKIFYGERE